MNEETPNERQVFGAFDPMTGTIFVRYPKERKNEKRKKKGKAQRAIKKDQKVRKND